MNLEKEFQRAGSTSEEIKDLVHDLYQQKRELEQKIHIFNVLSLARDMQEFAESIDVDSNHTSAIRFRHYRDYESGGNNVMFDLLDLHGEEVAPGISDVMDEQQEEIWGKCMGFLSSNSLVNVDIDFIKEEFTEKVQLSVSLLENTEEQILDLFLSKKLKSIVHFHQMHMGLPSNIEIGKKIKV